MDTYSLIKTSHDVAIFGSGVTGKAVARLCDKLGKRHRTFFETGDGATDFAEDDAKKCDIAVVSPGFQESHRWIKLAEQAGCRCVSELDFASCFWNGRIVAITGTNGKTTTTEFITYALNKCGINAVKCGNIGIAFSEIVAERNNEKAWAIVEVSSFQMKNSDLFLPNYVIWTNFDNDHLDIHANAEEYFSCKSKLILLADKKTSKKPTCMQCFVGPSVDEFAKTHSFVELDGKYAVARECTSLPKSSQLNTRTQRENFALIEKFWKENGLPTDALARSAESFEVPPHRLKKIATIKKKCGDGSIANVEFWDDSKATNFHAMRGALGSFDKPVTLIAGGKSKNEPTKNFLEIVNGKVKTLMLIGTSGQELYDAVSKNHGVAAKMETMLFNKRESLKDVMENVVEQALIHASDGDVILLSPGYSSLDWFQNYADRGNLFIECVLSLKSKNKTPFVICK